MGRPKVLLVIGTRPEAVKQAPVLRELKRRGLRVACCSTAQHRGLLQDALRAFGLRPEHRLGLMREDQSPEQVLGRVLRAMGPVLEAESPDLVLVQGDTTSALGAALAAFQRRIPVAHVEAGLRSFDPANPYPEEINRVLIDRVSSLRLAPTRLAARNLRREGLGRGVFVTGNTAVDAVRWGVKRARKPAFLRAMPKGARLIVVTLHRRESFGAPLRGALGALREVARRREDVLFVHPVHPNPNVRRQALKARHPRIRLIAPLPYPEFLGLVQRAEFLVTDSGGLQEEALSLRKPVLVLRRKTERPELLSAGGGRLVGTEPRRVAREVLRLLDDDALRRRMGRAPNPFGDGRAARRVAAAVLHHFGLGPRPRDWAPERSKRRS